MIGGMLIKTTFLLPKSSADYEPLIEKKEEETNGEEKVGKQDFPKRMFVSIPLRSDPCR